MTQTDRVFVIPAPGMKVRDPLTRRHVPETGALVVRDSYWLRRLTDGDVVEGQPPAESQE